MALERLYSLVREIAPRPVTVSGESRLVDDLGFDSIRLLELVVAIETEFDIVSIPEADTRRVSTVGELETVVMGLLERGQRE